MAKNIVYWLSKYKVFYILTWMVASFIIMLINYNPRTPWIPQWWGHMIILGTAVPVCYYTAYKLTPRYLYTRKIGAFISYLLLLAFLNAVVTFLFALYIYQLVTGIPVFGSFLRTISLFFETVLIDISLISISCIIKIIIDRYFMEQQILEIEKEKVTSELNFLRSQVNPHFLFNVMNTIYFQIDKANTDARLTVEKFSEMLRYQLYECNTDKIPIQKELHYIKNYVAIQTLRVEKDSDINLSVEGEMDDFSIAPLLILPIVENAFKHISNFKEAGKNRIQITIKKQNNDTLIIDALNTYDQAAGQKHLMQTGGLGIQNLQRRLELLYPEKHELNINKEENIFQTVLKLQYND
ncbi:MAG: histidine kinase [Mucilaginibacter sp.]|nr:histidine kinase [Mucilaginibacter sp.]